MGVVKCLLNVSTKQNPNKTKPLELFNFTFNKLLNAKEKSFSLKRELHDRLFSMTYKTFFKIPRQTLR